MVPMFMLDTVKLIPEHFNIVFQFPIIGLGKLNC